MALISTLMSTAPITASPEEMADEVARRMSEHRIGAVLVVRGGMLVGLFSERDLLERVVARGKDPAQTKVGDVATHEVVSVDAATPIRECARLLAERRIRHLPVTRGGEPIGIVSARDFFEQVATGLERVVDQARYEDALAGGEDPYDHLGGGYGG